MFSKTATFFEKMVKKNFRGDVTVSRKGSSLRQKRIAITIFIAARHASENRRTDARILENGSVIGVQNFADLYSRILAFS